MSIKRHLSEMVQDRAEPDRIHALTEFFFEHYPFSERDMHLDDDLLESVAQAHVHASMREIPANKDCVRVSGAGTVDELKTVLDSLEGPHIDGDRCAWYVAKELATGCHDASEETVLQLCRSALRLFGDTPLLVQIACRGEAIMARHTWDPADQVIFRKALVRSRWKRAYLAHRAKYCLYLDGGLSTEVLEFSPELARSRIDPKLAALGRHLVELREALVRLSTGRDAARDVRAAADRILSAGGRLFYEHGVRHAVLTAELEAGDAEQAIGFFEGKQPVLRLLNQLSKGSDLTAEALAAHATQLDPDGERSPEALLLLARTHEMMDRPKQMAACLHAALIVSSGDYESQSDAGRWLARYYLGLRGWESALETWTAWKPFSGCGTCRADMEFRREREIARCTKLLASSAK